MITKTGVEIWKCPCNQCLCVPVCKYFTIKELMDKCRLIAEYYCYPNFLYKKMNIDKCLKREEIIKC